MVGIHGLGGARALDVAGEYFAAMDDHSSVVLEIDELPLLKLAEYLIGRHLPDIAQVGDGVWAFMSFVRFAIDGNGDESARLVPMPAVNVVVMPNAALMELVMTMLRLFFPVHPKVQFRVAVVREPLD